MRKQCGGNKASIAYWTKRIFKPRYTRDGVSIESGNYAVELQVDGVRKRWSLGPAIDKKVVAERARDLYMYAYTYGWQKTLQKYRPTTATSADPSIAVFLAQVEKTCDLSAKTLRSYTNALRKIVTDSFGLDDPRKHGRGKGRKEWLAKVGAIRLSELTPVRVQQWKVAFIGRAGNDPIAQRSARVSANSFLRCAKSLFSPKLVKHLVLQLPDPLPFSQIEFEARGNMKYRSEFDISCLIRAAYDELATEPEVFKIFCLGTFAGLRRKEIDLLPWSSFRWEEGVIRIEATQHFSAKSEDSYSDVPLDVEVLELFRSFQARATGEFVIESAELPRPEALYNHYRCETHFQRLIDWLRSHGIRAKKPLHVLRKEFGSQLCRLHGIYAASRGLRHSSIAISAAFYTDAKARASVGLGHLLSANKVVEFRQEEVA